MRHGLTIGPQRRPVTYASGRRLSYFLGIPDGVLSAR